MFDEKEINFEIHFWCAIANLIFLNLPDGSWCYEELKRIVVWDIKLAVFDFLLQGLHFLLTVAGEPKLFFEAPENGRSSFHGGFA